MAYFGQQRKDYQNKRRAEWRLKIVAQLGGKCVVCGTTEDLEVHHKNPAAKELNVSGMWTRRPSVQAAELAKCELRCAKHHREAHASGCGTAARYRRGCRCEDCRTAYSTYRRGYRQTHLDQVRKQNREWMKANAKRLREQELNLLASGL